VPSSPAEEQAASEPPAGDHCSEQSIKLYA
jgi:hypothetical protein